jgi:hypothetical protein
MSSGREGFLSRWSRLKREPDPVAPPPASVTAEAPKEPVLPEGKTLDELVAELPRIEDLVPGQSLTAFMQPWVPDSVRNAALQRMWLLDPAIRDYVSPALDYAYDYNTPGAAPGFGPMETSSDAVREVADLFDRVLGGDGAKEETAATSDRHDNLSQSRDIGAPEHAAAQQDERDRPTGSEGGAMPVAASARPADLPRQERSAPADVATHNNDKEMKELRPAGRRHGGALPG